MKTIITVLLTIICISSYGQNLITITETFQTVPKGKMWVIYPGYLEPEAKPILLEMIKNQGSLFYQEFYNGNHKFHVLGNLIDMLPGSNVSEKRLIVGDNLQKVSYANLMAYSMKMMGAVAPKMMSNFLQWLNQDISMWGMCLERLEFKEGTKVRVSDCIKTMQLVEYPAN